ncbi:MAG TPA: DUF3618 domain-containing protein, partial [Mycobacteriales bacterium]
MSPRDPEHIQREIESSRTQLAATLDELAERVSPRRLADEAKTSATTFLQTPVGMAGIASVVLLIALGVARR